MANKNDNGNKGKVPEFRGDFLEAMQNAQIPDALDEIAARPADAVRKHAPEELAEKPSHAKRHEGARRERVAAEVVEGEDRKKDAAGFEGFGEIDDAAVEAMRKEFSGETKFGKDARRSSTPPRRG